MSKLEIEYCKSCGACCFDECKGKDGLCHKNPRHEICDLYPIMSTPTKTGIEYWKAEKEKETCMGILNKAIPVNLLEEIILRLNSGETGFEVKAPGFYFVSN